MTNQRLSGMMISGHVLSCRFCGRDGFDGTVIFFGAVRSEEVQHGSVLC
ncbi:MAG: hypothetical protein IKH27_12065 [Oscillospiraceae bacterium]|nr:hypothetical protein [Oscillospiraceae bacterium]